MRVADLEEHLRINPKKELPWEWLKFSKKEKIDILRTQYGEFPIFLKDLERFQYFMVKNKGKPVCQLILQKSDHEPYWIARQVQTDPEWRGKGVTTALVHYIIADRQTKLISDDVMSDGGLKIWHGLERSGQINVKIIDTKTMEKYYPGQVDTLKAKGDYSIKRPEDDVENIGSYRFYYVTESHVFKSYIPYELLREGREIDEVLFGPGYF